MFLIKGIIKLPYCDSYQELCVQNKNIFGENKIHWSCVNTMLFTTKEEAKDFLNTHNELFNNVQEVLSYEIIQI